MQNNYVVEVTFHYKTTMLMYPRARVSPFKARALVALDILLLVGQDVTNKCS